MTTEPTAPIAEPTKAIADELRTVESPEIRQLLINDAMEQVDKPNDPLDQKAVEGADSIDTFSGLDIGRERAVVFSTITGAPHVILERSRAKVLSLKRSDGVRAFWHSDLGGVQPNYHRGTIKCYLHPDHENRAYFETLGLVGLTCNRSDPSKKSRDDLPSKLALDMHMKRAHPSALAVIEADEARQTADKLLAVQERQAVTAEATLELQRQAMAADEPKSE